VTRASELLHVAQPAITKTIKGLESELGINLFKKQGRNIALTEYGLYLRERLDGVFSILDSLPEEIERKKNQREKTIRLNVLSASIFTMESVVQYKNMHPEVVFNMIQFAEKDSSDINITTEPVENNAIKSTPNRCVIEEKIFIAVSKSSKFANFNSLTLKELRDEPFIYISGSKTYKKVCDSFFKGLDFKPKIGFETDSSMTVKNIIGADAGVGFWPEHSWGDVHDANVKLIPVSDVDLKRNVVIELNESAGGGQCVKEFYEYITGQLKKKLKQ
jgi:DNA-binding transcriptional LysR family regulator